jgi:hypothetical protein
VDVGRAQGIEAGHVLALSRPGPIVPIEEARPWPWGLFSQVKTVAVPNERFGLIFIFRVFDQVSYGLVLNSSREVRMGDIVSKP